MYKAALHEVPGVENIRIDTTQGVLKYKRLWAGPQGDVGVALRAATPLRCNAPEIVKRRRPVVRIVTRGGDVVVAYDMVTRDAALDSLRYVFDARQPPFSDLEADAFEEQFAFPPTVCWVRGGWARKSVRGFTAGVYS